MNRIPILLAIILTAGPALAGNVVITAVDEGNEWIAIRYVADAIVSGFALNVSVDNGVIVAVADYNVGECTAEMRGYGMFPGNIEINSDTGQVDYYGSPVAPNTAPGAEGTGIGTDSIVLDMTARYMPGFEPALKGTLCRIKVSENCNVSITGNSIRGNVVMADASQAVLNVVNVSGFDCLVIGEVVGGVFITQAMYDMWVQLGKPSCWCYECHSNGDIDGDCDVDTSDVHEFINGWNDWAHHPCGDTNNDGVVDTTDVMGDPNTGIGGVVYGWITGCGTCVPVQ